MDKKIKIKSVEMRGGFIKVVAICDGQIYEGVLLVNYPTINDGASDFIDTSCLSER